MPQRFRVEVALRPKGYIWIRSYGLRWDPAAMLIDPLVQALAIQVQDICPVSPGENHEDYRGSPPFQTRSYLDNRVHWVEPRDKDKSNSSR